jgi:hypothetical protein
MRDRLRGEVTVDTCLPDLWLQLNMGAAQKTPAAARSAMTATATSYRDEHKRPSASLVCGCLAGRSQLSCNWFAVALQLLCNARGSTLSCNANQFSSLARPHDKQGSDPWNSMVSISAPNRCFYCAAGDMRLSIAVEAAGPAAGNAQTLPGVEGENVSRASVRMVGLDRHNPFCVRDGR